MAHMVSGSKKVKMNEYSPEQRRGTAIRELAGPCAYDEKESIIFGEYFNNKERAPVNIYRYNFINDNLDIIYTFNFRKKLSSLF